MARKGKSKGEEIELPESDHTFAYIAGYTSCGFPYGITWEQAEEMELAEAEAKTRPLPPQAHPVSLKQVADEMQMVSDLITVYFKRTTGEFIPIHEEYAWVEDEEEEVHLDRPEWEKEAIRETADVLAHLDEGDYVALPSKYEIHEYSIIEDFCYSIDEAKVSNDLQRSIKGKGAFRRFTEAIHRHSIHEQWYRFREEAYLRIARDWCEENRITWHK